MEKKAGTLSLLARELGLVLQPLEQRLSGENADVLFGELGLRLPNGFISQASVVSAVTSSVSAVADLGPRVDELVDAIEADDTQRIILADAAIISQIGNVFNAISQISAAISSTAGAFADLTPQQRGQVVTFAQELPQRMVDFLLVEYFHRKSSDAAAILALMGLIDDMTSPGVSGDPLAPPFRQRAVHLNRLGDLLFDPTSYLRNVYGWDTPGFDGLELLTSIKGFLQERDLPSTIIAAPGLPLILEAYIFRLSIDPVTSPPSLTLRLRIPATQDFKRTYDLRDPWSLTISAQARFDAGLSALFSPPLNATFHPPTGIANLILESQILAQPSGSAIMLLGQTGGSRLEAQHIAATLGLTAGWDSVTSSANGEPVVKVEIGGGTVIIDLSEGDSFLQSVVSDVRFEGNFDLQGRWQPSSGLAFEGSGGTELAIPAHINLGSADLRTLYFILSVSSGPALKLETSCEVATHLGPLFVSIDRVGGEATLTFPDGRDGNLGPLDLSFDFKTPTNIGLSIDSGGFKGGGFLGFEPDEQRYVGFLELEFKEKIAIKALGLLTTRLPDGSDGFSLLIIITAEFTPIQLGFGFTLNGIGGLLGLNRTANVERLRTGVKDNTLSSILFPQNILANANRIISDLRQVFPPQADRFIFGPMAKIGWGSPTLITIDLGLMIEVPNPVRLLILGVVRAQIPNEEERKKEEAREGREIPRILQLQINFLGEINFEEEWLTFDAILYDSKLLSFTLSGDMAVRLSWGSEPNFLLTVGGFHPAYNPPTVPVALPNLQRLTLSLLSGNNPRLTLETYFAVTSNTVQFGARLELYAVKSKFNVSGFLSFDVLFQFSPFLFIADIGAMLALRIGSSNIASISVSLTLFGPTPWHARGTAKLKICWFFTLKVRFNKTFGEERDTRLDDVPVLPLLQAALSNTGNWEVQIPSGRHALVSVRKIAVSGGEVVADPAGVIIISQKVVPLNVTIQKFGNQQPSDGNHFTIKHVRVAPVEETDLTEMELLSMAAVQEHFAPAQFFEKSDTEKLSSRSFEYYDSGVKLTESEELVTDYAARRPVEYEVFYPKEQRHQGLRRRPDLLPPDFAGFSAGTRQGAIAESPLSFANKAKSALAPSAVRFSQEQFVVVSAIDLLPVTEEAVAASEAGAYSLMNEMIRNNPDREGELQVVPTFEVNRS